MNLAVDQFLPHKQHGADLPARLAAWYSAHSSIRRLWAIEDRDTLIVFVALEPTFDGDDTLPVWLASSRDWAIDLRSLIEREVQLQLVFSDVLERSYVSSDAALVAELNWRDACISGQGNQP